MTTENIISIISLLISSGAIGGIFFLRSRVRKANAEATAVENANSITIAEEWREIAGRREAQLAEKDKKIDTLYIQINEWRTKFHESETEKHKLALENATMKIKSCGKRACKDREPQSGY